MRIIFMGNNFVACQVLRYLLDQGEEIAALVLHPPEKRKYGQEMLDMAGLNPERVIDGSTLNESKTLAAIRSFAPDMGISILFDYILKKEFLCLFPRPVINLHPSLLPWNKGQYPNVWAIVERTPSGVTLHTIDEGIDTGDILVQREVAQDPTDTGESLYRKLETASVELFRDSWPDIKANLIVPSPQAPGAGTYHRTRDVDKIDLIDPDATYRAGDLIDILRARTFPPYKGAYIEKDGRRTYLRLSLQQDGEP